MLLKSYVFVVVDFVVFLDRGQTNYGSMAFHWTTLTSSYDINTNNTKKLSYHQQHQHHQCVPQQPPQKQHQHHFLPRLPETIEKSVLSETTKKWNHCALTPPKLRSLYDLDRARGSGINSANNFYRNVPAPPNTALAFSK